jgi:hypothetical protein
MRECPYCEQIFSTKQRLISHLTKTKKCYSIETVGIPPILLELMSGSGSANPNDNEDDHEEETTSKPKAKAKVKKGTGASIPISSATTQVHSVSEISRPVSAPVNECPTCEKRFVTEANLNRHVLSNKCKKPKGKAVGVAKGQPQSKEDVGEGDFIDIPKFEPAPLVDPYQAPSQRKTKPNYKPTVAQVASKASRDESRKAEGLPRAEHAYRGGLPQTSYDPTRAQPSYDTARAPANPGVIKYIDRDDYFNYLVHTMGSKAGAISFIRNCAHRRLNGDLAMIQKIHFEGKERNQFPFEVTDTKSKTIYYKTPNGMVVDEKGLYVRNSLIENIQNCYLKLSNHIISSNLNKSETIFGDENHLKKIQEHLVELSDEKVKDRLLTLVIEALKK